MTQSELSSSRYVKQGHLPSNGNCRSGLQTRRRFMQGVGASIAGFAVGSIIGIPLSVRVAHANIGPLLAADSNGVRLPEGFSSRIVAFSGRRIADGYRWHIYPDGGATFATEDGGWVYVSNSETSSFLGGGASAVRFEPNGAIVDAYRILSGTNRNCAGGSTPWGTWLSCEEIDFGRVFECDPIGVTAAVARDALGYFKHEAVAVDTKHGHLYMTEDESDGRLYRFVPEYIDVDGIPQLESGLLQVAQVENATGTVRWLVVPDPRPDPSRTPTREQVPASSAFKGGEGIWYHDRKVYFTTKGDGRVWCLKLDTQTLTSVYDARNTTNPMLTGVDNLTVFPTGDVLVCEDGGDMQIVAINGVGDLAPLLQVVGQDESEMTGLAFSPDGSRLYFSSQRGGSGLIAELLGLGLTYEVTGPFATLFAG